MVILADLIWYVKQFSPRNAKKYDEIRHISACVSGCIFACVSVSIFDYIFVYVSDCIFR